MSEYEISIIIVTNLKMLNIDVFIDAVRETLTVACYYASLTHTK